MTSRDEIYSAFGIMNPDSLSARPKATTFIYRRWHNTKKDYVDTRGSILPSVAKAAKYVPLSPFGPDPSIPPRDGSSSFLNLPAELRLAIYGYVINDENGISKAVTRNLLSSTTYVYLWRSPGRMTDSKPKLPPCHVLRLFEINRQTREELLDHCFSKRTFVLEVSLYSKAVGGLDVLPARLPGGFPMTWVRRLLLITTLESDKVLLPKDIADLRPLQQMTYLKHLRLVVRPLGPMDPSKVPSNPIRAVLQAIPSDVVLSLGADKALQGELLKEVGSDLAYLFRDDAATATWYELLEAAKHRFEATRGCISGSRVNHGECKYPVCLEEADKGIRCVNSQTPPPQALPSLELSQSVQQ